MREGKILTGAILLVSHFSVSPLAQRDRTIPLMFSISVTELGGKTRARADEILNKRTTV
jgi:hypothetical protein